MKLSTFQEFPFCVIPRENLGARHPSGFLMRSRDVAFEIFYRLRSFRITGGLGISTQQGSRSFSFASQEEFVHSYADPFTEGLSQNPTNERHLACLGGGIYKWETRTPPRVFSFPSSDPEEGDATVTIRTEFFNADYAVRESRDVYSFQFGAIAVVSVEDAPGIPGGVATIEFSGDDTGNGFPTLSTPWGRINGGVSFVPPSGVGISGSVSLEPLSYWAYANEDGSDPWWDVVTGVPVGSNPRLLGFANDLQ